MDDLIKGVKIGKILTKDDEKKETKKIVAIVLAVIAAVAAVAGAAYAIYRFVNRDYYDDFEDDFEDLFEDEDEDDYVERLKSHFFPMEGLKAVFRIDLVEEKSSLIIDINDSKLNCYRGTVEQADVTAKVKTAVFEQVLDGTKTFQSAFMSGELSAQGNFKILRNFDTIFRFQNI